MSTKKIESKVKITGKAKSFETGEKRFFVPGVKIAGRCPKCGAKYNDDFAEAYLSYPPANKTFERTLYCLDESCGHEWAVCMRLSISLDLVTS
jgi:hypothetical protein